MRPAAPNVPYVSARLPATAAERLRVLYTDLPEPAIPDRLLKIVQAAHVTLPSERAWVGGGGRLVRVPLGTREIRAGRRFAVQVLAAGQSSPPSAETAVPAALLLADGTPLRTADGQIIIPAPSPPAPPPSGMALLRTVDGETVLGSDGQPVYVSI